MKTNLLDRLNLLLADTVDLLPEDVDVSVNGLSFRALVSYVLMIALFCYGIYRLVFMKKIWMDSGMHSADDPMPPDYKKKNLIMSIGFILIPLLYLVVVIMTSQPFTGDPSMDNWIK